MVAISLGIPVDRVELKECVKNSKDGKYDANQSTETKIHLFKFERGSSDKKKLYNWQG